VKRIQDNMNELWASETVKALENFSVSRIALDPVFIRAFAYVKLACTQINTESGYLDVDRGEAIAAACRDLIDGKYCDQIVVDPYQGGAGTSTNMNFNEVIAAIAQEQLFDRNL